MSGDKLADITTRDRVETIKYIVSWLKNYTGSSCILVYGDVGVGKTWLIKTACELAGFKLIIPDPFDYVIEGSINREMLKKSILSLLSTRSWFEHTAVLLDRPYAMGLKSRDLKKFLARAKNPLFIEDLTKKYYAGLSCSEIEVKPLPKTFMVKLIRKHLVENIRPDYSYISSDARASILLAYGSQPLTETTYRQAVEKLLKTGDYRDIEHHHIPSIIDSFLESEYTHRDLLNMILKMQSYGFLKNPRVLANLRARRVSFSTFFFDKVRAVQGEEI